MQARIDTRTPLSRIVDRMRPPYVAPAAKPSDKTPDRPIAETRPRPIALVRKAPDVGPTIPQPIDQTALADLAALHGVPPELLVRQVELMRQIAIAIQDKPRSYRNVVDKIEDVQRAALWLMSGATTQAGFRRFFGTEGFMRPTKSVAWDFYNRVFKRGPFAAS